MYDDNEPLEDQDYDDDDANSGLDLTDPQTREALIAVMKEISLSMHKIAVERDQIKEIITAAASTFKIEKALLRKVSRFYYTKDIAKFENEGREIKHLYKSITTKPTA